MINLIMLLLGILIGQTSGILISLIELEKIKEITNDNKCQKKTNYIWYKEKRVF